jgi:hypothetical protein
MMAAVCTSETSVYSYEITRRRVPVSCHVHIDRCDYLNAHFWTRLYTLKEYAGTTLLTIASSEEYAHERHEYHQRVSQLIANNHSVIPHFNTV